MSAAPRAGTFLLSFALATFAWMTAPVFAAPENRVVTFQVHENPGDPQSPIRLTFTLQIAPAARDADAIGWHIRTVEITEHALDGAAARSWSDVLPSQADPAHIWWVTHADPENPSPNEFIDLPQLDGTAAPRDSTTTPLRYALTSTSTTDSRTGEKSALATYSIAFDSNPDTPIVEGEEEPVESGGTVDPH